MHTRWPPAQKSQHCNIAPRMRVTREAPHWTQGELDRVVNQALGKQMFQWTPHSMSAWRRITTCLSFYIQPQLRFFTRFTDTAWCVEARIERWTCHAHPHGHVETSIFLMFKRVLGSSADTPTDPDTNTFHNNVDIRFPMSTTHNILIDSDIDIGINIENVRRYNDTSFYN